MNKTKGIWIYILTLLILCMVQSVQAREVFFDEQGTGWYWYETKPNPILKEKDEETIEVTAQQALQELNSLQTKLEESKALAIMYPTTEHVKNYIEMHNTVIQKASLFSSTWQEVIWQTPELDFSIQNPTDNSARHVYYDEVKVTNGETVKALSDEYGLFFFFRSDCSYCHAFAPILKNFENKYGITVMAISLDGGTLPDYPNATVDNGMAHQLGINVVPAIVALHPQSKHIIPLSFGFVSEEELLRRMSTLAQSQGEQR